MWCTKRNSLICLVDDGELKHKMNLRYKLQIEAPKGSEKKEIKSRYKKLRNEITQKMRRTKSNYFANEFDKIRNISEYWKLVKRQQSVRNKRLSLLQNTIYHISNVQEFLLLYKQLPLRKMTDKLLKIWI